ncbi:MULTISPECIES: ABC transporter substrate-binding protein [Paenibacillus]|uniref:ABC transporter substrate-binding protein n=1 Tax=Paenibacillus TaxID=44249 RepID=UPI0007832A7C|nr:MULTISPECIES: sugar ABC transporter substrate-binding protein [Paenibacillus]
MKKSRAMKSIIPLVVTALLVFLSACSSGGQSSSPSPSASGGASPGASSPQPASDGGAFDWKKHSGGQINVMLNQHPYAEAIIARLPQFEELTGIKVNYSITPEENYFDKLTTALNARNGNPDVFMTGSYQLWEYAPADYIQELDSFLNDPSKTDSGYDINDIFKGILDGDRWDLVPGHAVGTGSLWALPLGFESNVLIYNKRALESIGAQPPKTFDELIEIGEKLNGWNGEGSYGVAVRGTRSWATIHPGYMSAFSMSGAKDFEIQDGKLVSKLDSPEAIEITKKFAELVKRAGPKDWTNYTWYQASSDLGAGKAAMAFDADIFAIFQGSEGASQEAGNLGTAPPPIVKEGQPVGANEWIWSIAMNQSSKKKDAAWLFMQYFTGKEHTLWGATQAKVFNPIRQSVWEDPDFLARISKFPGYYQTFRAVIDNTSIKFTPQPEFFNTTTEWAAALQDIVTGQADAESRMKQLAKDINERVSRIRVQ